MILKSSALSSGTPIPRFKQQVTRLEDLFMGCICEVAVKDLSFWLNNYRFGTAKDQDDAFKKLSSGKGFEALKVSLVEHGYQKNALITVSDDNSEQGGGKFIVYDGNRRLAAIKAIKLANKITVYYETDTERLNAILEREHTNSLAGRQRWTSVQQARYDRNRWDQGLMPKCPDNVKQLAVLETALGEEIEQKFNLSTFARVYNNKKLKLELGINDGNPRKIAIKKPALLQEVVKDIRDGAINTRKLNIANNVEAYIDRLVDNQEQSKRTNLGEFSDDSDDSSEPLNRLFSEDMLAKLTVFENQKFIYELRNAPTTKYPHLLTLATRAVLDTLNYLKKNKGKSSPSAPSALSRHEAFQYMDQDQGPEFQDVETLVHSLGEFAHDVTQKRSKDHIENSREIVEKLIDEISKEI